MNIHKATENDYRAIKRLYNSAFPINERAPFFFVKRRALQNRATMFAAEENGEFIGFAYTVSNKNFIYLFFFAVVENKRGNGYGSKILRWMKSFYAEKNIFLAREPLDSTAQNSFDRTKRRDFYINNGFIDLPFQLKEANTIYDIMSTSEKFVPADYNELIYNWAGKLVLHFVNMKII